MNLETLSHNSPAAQLPRGSRRPEARRSRPKPTAGAWEIYIDRADDEQLDRLVRLWGWPARLTITESMKPLLCPQCHDEHHPAGVHPLVPSALAHAIYPRNRLAVREVCAGIDLLPWLPFTPSGSRGGEELQHYVRGGLTEFGWCARGDGWLVPVWVLTPMLWRLSRNPVATAGGPLEACGAQTGLRPEDRA